jgi:tRNA (cytidine/uridine-2'-O-)-methyltransferase
MWLLMSQPLCHLVLYEPEIPPNSGNIIRLAANTGTVLHFIEPLGFTLDDKQLRRAGLDYHEFCSLHIHPNLGAALSLLKSSFATERVFPCTTKANRFHSQIQFQPGDALLFGPESRGLPPEVLARFNQNAWLRIPMLPNSRSLNLSNAAAIVVYELWRQLGFAAGQ